MNLWFWFTGINMSRCSSRESGSCPSTFYQSLVKRPAWWKDQPSLHCSPPCHSIPMGRGRGCKGAEKGQAVTPLTAQQNLAVLCWGSPSVWQRAGVVWQYRSLHVFKLNSVITAAASLASQLKKKAFFLKFLEQDVPWKLPFSDPTLKTHNVKHFRTWVKKKSSVLD